MAINYQPLIAQLNLSPLAEGLRAHQQNKIEAEARADQQRRFDYAVSQDQAKIARRDAFTAEFTGAINNPSQAAFDGLRAKYPDFHEPIDNGWKSYSDGQKHQMITNAGTLVSALVNNQPGLALHSLRQRRTALSKAGIDTTETDSLINMVDSGDPVQLKAARGIAGMVLAQASGDKFDQVWARLNKVDNDEELQPDRQRAAAADADWKEARAFYAPARERSAVDRAQASADDARSRKARRDSLPSRQGGAAPRTEPAHPSARTKPRTSQPTATGPDGRKYQVRGGKWVPVS